MSNGKAFRITDGKGFQMRFANGWSISVQFGIGNYCENSNIDWGFRSNPEVGAEGSSDAEIAIIQPNGEFFEHPDYDMYDQVCGRLSADRVAYFLEWTVNQPN